MSVRRAFLLALAVVATGWLVVLTVAVQKAL